MVLLWIIIAVVVSCILFKREGIKKYHLVWALLPVDYYGINITGIIIKPYMLFMTAFILYRGKVVLNSKQQKFIIGCLVAFSLSDVYSGFSVESIMQHFYFILILIFSIQYTSISAKECESVRKAVILSGLAFSCSFILAYYTYRHNLPVGQIKGSMIYDYMSFSTETYRFRGFEIDPNAFCIMFIPVIPACVDGLYKKNQSEICIATLCTSLACVLLSKSRAGLLVSILTLSMTIIVVGYQRIRKLWPALLFLAAAVILLIVALRLKIINGSDVALYFESRSQPQDAYGRFNIWKECLKYAWDESPLFGVGANQIRLFEPLGRACHNTWLEWICSLGFVMGICIDLVFIQPLFALWKDVTNPRVTEICWACMSYSGIFMMLMTIDYIASTYLLFFFSMIITYQNDRWINKL